MALTKGRTVIWTAQALAAGGADVTSSWVDATTFYAGTLMVKVVNSGGVVTTGATVRVEVAGTDSSPVVYYLTPTYATTTGSGDQKHWVWEFPQGTMFFRVVVTCPTGNAATLDGEYTAVTGI